MALELAPYWLALAVSFVLRMNQKLAIALT